MRLSILLAAIPMLLLALTLSASAGPDHLRPDDHAPIGVMGDHTHGAGEVMFSYRYGRMVMDGNRDRANRVPARSVVGTGANPGEFRAVPEDMVMEVHMIGAMYAVHENVTLVGMLPLVRKQMDHLRRDGVTFRTKSEGIGDVRAGALLPFFEQEGHQAHLNAIVSFPTGSTTEKDDIPGMPASVEVRQRLPYPMQIGSGTIDLMPGATYRGRQDDLSWGLQGLGTLRTGNNDEGYRLGNAAEGSAWLAYQWSDWLSTSARAKGWWWDDIHQSDDRLDRTVIPTADPDLRGGQRIDALFGLNILFPFAGKHRFAIEGGVPVYQWLNGPQLETDWRIVAGWQSAFEVKLPHFQSR